MGGCHPGDSRTLGRWKSVLKYRNWWRVEKINVRITAREKSTRSRLFFFLLFITEWGFNPVKCDLLEIAWLWINLVNVSGRTGIRESSYIPARPTPFRRCKGSRWVFIVVLINVIWLLGLCLSEIFIFPIDSRLV